MGFQNFVVSNKIHTLKKKLKKVACCIAMHEMLCIRVYIFPQLAPWAVLNIPLMSADVLRPTDDVTGYCSLAVPIQSI